MTEAEYLTASALAYLRATRATLGQALVALESSSHPLLRRVQEACSEIEMLRDELAKTVKILE